MANTIHATKLHSPRPRADWMARERLLRSLDGSLREGRRLCLVSAPAGAGKTTLLAHWLDERRLRAAWLSLEPEDDEPTHFWICVLQALQSAVAGLGQGALEALSSAAPPPPASVLPGLLNEIGAVGERLILVLDDYHVLSARGIHESITTVVEHLPEQMRLVICTRADPPLPLARWRARDELIEVRAGDLRFTADEALALLNQRMALNLRVEDAEQLVERTEGWAVGLQLAGLSLQGQADPRKAIQSLAGGRHFVLEYLLEEVLARQPEATQRFLLQTSILNRMCGPACDAVTGEQGGWATLLELQRQNLFVVQLDEERYWYRYHHLFAELLRARLQQTAPDLLNRLHLRASIWYEEHGELAEALHHALAVQDWERAAHLLEAREEDWWTGSDVKILNMVTHLPDEVIVRGPKLSVYKAWFLLISGQLSSAAALLDRTERSLGKAEPNEENLGLAGFVALQQAYSAELSGRPGSLEVDARRLAHVPESRGGMRNSAEVILAYVLYRNGDFAEAARLLEATIERDMRSGATNGIPIAASRLARMWISEGRLQDAAELCRKCLAVIEERGKWRFYVAGNMSIVLGDVLREWNRLDEAEACVREGIRDNEPWGIAHAQALGYAALARVLLARGDRAGAAAALAVQEQLTGGRTLPPDLTSETRAVQVRLWLASDERESVAHWAGEWSQEAGQGADFRNEQDGLTLARAWLALGEPGRAAELLSRLQDGARRAGRARRAAESLLLLGVAWQAQGQGKRAAETMEQALSLAAPMGCLRLFLDEGPAALAVVAAVSGGRGVAPDGQAFARDVLAAATDRVPDRAGVSGTPGARPLIEALTPREHEVLLLLAAGGSNREIAERLVISVHAVKKHTGNIYGKLGVTSRTQAIARARELGLLSEGGWR